MREKDVRISMKKGMISLLTKTPYSEITVTDLVRESHVARASFYRIYERLSDVVDDLANDFREKIFTFILPVLRASDEDSIKMTLKKFFTSVKEERTLFVDILPGNISFFLSRLRTNTLLDKNKEYKDLKEKYDELLCFIDIFAIAHIWRYHGYKESVEDMVNYSCDIVLKLMNKQ